MQRMDPFAELSKQAEAAGVRLIDAYKHAGMADSTFYRHRLSRFKPRWDVLTEVETAIRELAHGAAGAD